MEPVEWLGKAASPRQLHLISHQPAGRLHSQLETGPASLALKRNGREQARLHPVDAQALGILDGQTIRLWNARGACLATAQVADSVRQGVIVLPTGAWFLPTGEDGLDISGNPNVLTVDIPTSKFGQGCAAHTCLVNVEPYQGSAPDAMQAYDAELAELTV